MIKLYIKQHVFSWSTRFTVKDESGRDAYFVEGELFSWGKKLHVYNANQVEVIYIQQKLMSWLPKYHIFIQGTQVAELVKELTFFKPQYSVHGLGWNVEGEFWGHEYTVSRGNVPVVTIAKEWFTWGDSYALSIANDRDVLPALAVVLAIDCAVEEGQSTTL
ncbi:MAG: LURP-one-related/scramblase family protein [Lachnospiraceae bacterium]